MSLTSLQDPMLQEFLKNATPRDSKGGYDELEPDKEMLCRLDKCLIGEYTNKKSGKLIAYCLFPFTVLTGPNEGKRNRVFQNLTGNTPDETQDNINRVCSILTSLQREMPDNFDDLGKVVSGLEGEGVAVCAKETVKDGTSYINVYINELADISSLVDGKVQFEGKGDTVDLDSMDRESLEALASDVGVEYEDAMSDDDLRDLIDDAVSG